MHPPRSGAPSVRGCADATLEALKGKTQRASAEALSNFLCDRDANPPRGTARAASRARKALCHTRRTRLTREIAHHARMDATGCLVGVLASPWQAVAQDYPKRTIKFVVPFPAGGPADTIS